MSQQEAAARSLDDPSQAFPAADAGAAADPTATVALTTASATPRRTTIDRDIKLPNPRTTAQSSLCPHPGNPRKPKERLRIQCNSPRLNPKVMSAIGTNDRKSSRSVAAWLA